MVPHQVIKHDICSIVHGKDIVTARIFMTQPRARIDTTGIQNTSTKPVGRSVDGIWIEDKCDISRQRDITAVLIRRFVGFREWIGSVDVNRQVIVRNMAACNVPDYVLEESTGR